MPPARLTSGMQVREAQPGLQQNKSRQLSAPGESGIYLMLALGVLNQTSQKDPDVPCQCWVWPRHSQVRCPPARGDRTDASHPTAALVQAIWLPTDCKVYPYRKHRRDSD